jgi:Fe-Mn family superoxide dismutase
MEMPMLSLTRRQMLLATGAGAASLLLPKLSLTAAEPAPAFTLPKLPYAVDALEPHIDAETMTIHHTKHHQAYVDNLNKLVAGTDWATKSIDDVVKSVKKDAPEKIRQGVINNGGGHWNHSFFWTIMAPPNKGGKPSGELVKALETYGGLEKLVKDVGAAAAARFGSGWAWVVVGPDKKLEVTHTGNQEDPVMDGKTPILGIDVWEHAYYLKYRNLRAKYVEAWWNVANWDVISDHYAKAAKG